MTALKEKRIRGAAMTLPSKQIKTGEFEQQFKPFLKMKNVLIAPALGNPMPENKKKSIRKLAQAVINFLENKDLSLAVNPMEVFPGSRKKYYPISRGRNHGVTPLVIGR